MNIETETTARALGRVLGHAAVDLRLRGLPFEVWRAYMAQKVDALAETVPEPDRDAFRSELLEAFGAEVDRRVDTLNAQPAGRA